MTMTRRTRPERSPLSQAGEHAGKPEPGNAVVEYGAHRFRPRRAFGVDADVDLGGPERQPGPASALQQVVLRELRMLHRGGLERVETVWRGEPNTRNGSTATLNMAVSVARPATQVSQSRQKRAASVGCARDGDETPEVLIRTARYRNGLTRPRESSPAVVTMESPSAQPGLVAQLQTRQDASGRAGP